MPPSAEIVGADVIGVGVIYTLLAGSTVRRADTTTLRLRFRFSNDGSIPVLIGGDAVRLAVGQEVLIPTSGLNEILPSHSVRQGVIGFELPAGTRQVVLEVHIHSATAKIPLDLTPTAQPAATDQLDTGDALSHAILAPLIREPRPLIVGTNFGYTLTAATARRFVNALRIVLTIRMANRSRSPRYFGGDGFRLLVDNQATAPVAVPNQMVLSNSERSDDVVFDIPPTSRTVVLRVTEQGTTADLKFELPSVVR
jgi:hypothetical protein